MQKTTLRQNVQGGDRTWFVVDATGKTLGRISADICFALRGKHRVDYTPHADSGDYVVVINAEKVAVTGKKESRKNYYRHSGYLGHLRIEKLWEVREKYPERIIERAVKGMMPRTRQTNAQLKRLHVVVGPQNPYEAQKPQVLPEFHLA